MTRHIGIILILVATTTLAVPIEDGTALAEDHVIAVFRDAVTNEVQEHEHQQRTPSCKHLDKLDTRPCHDASKCRQSDGSVPGIECCAGNDHSGYAGKCADGYERKEMGLCNQGHQWCKGGGGRCSFFECVRPGIKKTRTCTCKNDTPRSPTDPACKGSLSFMDGESCANCDDGFQLKENRRCTAMPQPPTAPA